MDFKQIQELIKLVSKSGISEFSMENEEIRLKIKTNYSVVTEQVNAPQMVVAAPVQPIVTTAVPVAPSSNEPKETPKATQDTPVDGGNLITIKSPIVGTFYRSSGPDKDPFVKVGDDIQTGSVLCIIEAMKLFNEIESEVNGKVVKILVDDASPVEFDQPLFLIQPS